MKRLEIPEFEDKKALQKFLFENHGNSGNDFKKYCGFPGGLMFAGNKGRGFWQVFQAPNFNRDPNNPK